MISRIIKATINLVPRPIMQRVAELIVPVIGLFYLGRAKCCPVCGAQRRKFLPYGYTSPRPNALCPSCLALERHRLLWLYISNHTTLLKRRPKLLHIAPEVSLMRKFNRLYKGYPSRYITADLESPLAHLHFDVEKIPLEDNYAEVIICNHLLEHVNNDIKAMSELYRVLRPGGYAFLLSPVEYDRPTTFEDDSITDKKLRTEIFGQYDHRRIYGLDYATRLQSVGFEVEQIRYYQELPPDLRERYALTDEIIYMVKK